MAINLAEAVRSKIKELGVAEASRFYGVSTGTISNWLNKNTSPSIAAVEATLDALPVKEEAVHEAEPNLTMWEGRKVAILLPVYREFHADTHFTLFANYIKYGPSKIALLPPQKRTVIHEGRNHLIHRAMKTDAESFIMCDSDMVLPFGEGGFFNQNWGAKIPLRCGNHNSISRIMAHGKEAGIVGALYFGRHRKGSAQCSIGFEQPEKNAMLRRHEQHGLIRTGWVGTGFIKIERWVIEKLKSEIDSGKFPDALPITPDRPYGYFSPIRVGVGEDVSFGRRAEEVGIASYVDADLECLHMGDEAFGSHNTAS
jgi:hypothetical protein